MLVTHLSSFSLDRREALTLYTIYIYISHAALSLSSLSMYFLYVCRIMFNSSSLYVPSMVLVCRDVCLPFSLSLLPLLHKYYQYVMFFKMMGGVRVRY